MLNLLAWPTRLPFIIDWSAWAALATGVLAVLAALSVGRRQIAIASHQVDIAERQAEILDKQAATMDRQSQTDAIRLRSELFPRRIELFEALMRAAEECSQINNQGVAIKRLQEVVYQGYFLFDIETGQDIITAAQQLTTSYCNAIILKITRETAAENFPQAFRDWAEYNAQIGKGLSDLLPRLGSFLVLH